MGDRAPTHKDIQGGKRRGRGLPRETEPPHTRIYKGESGAAVACHGRQSRARKRTRYFAPPPCRDRTRGKAARPWPATGDKAHCSMHYAAHCPLHCSLHCPMHYAAHYAAALHRALFSALRRALFGALRRRAMFDALRRALSLFLMRRALFDTLQRSGCIFTMRRLCFDLSLYLLAAHSRDWQRGRPIFSGKSKAKTCDFRSTSGAMHRTRWKKARKSLIIIIL